MLFFFLSIHHHFAPPILLVTALFPKIPWNFELWKMPRRTGNAASTKSVELVKQDQLEFDDPDEVDEEEEVEYEEVEEEVEYEEVEEDEDDDDEDEEEEEETEVVANHDIKTVDIDQKDENEKGKHAELLALPPHGAEVYVGGISSDVSSEDLKQLFESVGEVVEVSN